MLPWRNNRKSDISHQVYELRLLVTKVYRQCWKLEEEKRKLITKIASNQI